MAGGWHLAQYNIARLKAPLDDPLLADFVANIDPINALGDRSPGFVWRHQTEEGNSTAVRPRPDKMIIINFTVWESVEALYDFAFKSGHLDVFRRRREWFEHLSYPFAVLWWIPSGHIPTVEEAEERLRHLTEHGPTPHAFTFKQRFPAPDAAPQLAVEAEA